MKIATSNLDARNARCARTCETAHATRPAETTFDQIFAVVRFVCLNSGSTTNGRDSFQYLPREMGVARQGKDGIARNCESRGVLRVERSIPCHLVQHRDRQLVIHHRGHDNHLVGGEMQFVVQEGADAALAPRQSW